MEKKIISLVCLFVMFAVSGFVFAEDSDVPSQDKEVVVIVEPSSEGSGGGGGSCGHPSYGPKNMDINYSQNANIDQGRFQSSSWGTREQEAIAGAGNFVQAGNNYSFESMGINGAVAGGSQEGAGNGDQGQKETVYANQYVRLSDEYFSSDIWVNFSANTCIAGEQEVDSGYAKQQNFAIGGNAGESTNGYMDESHLSLVGSFDCQEINGIGSQYQESLGNAYGNLSLSDNFWQTSIYDYSSANISNYQRQNLDCGSASQSQIGASLNLYETSIGSMDVSGGNLSFAAQSSEIIGGGESMSYQGANAYQSVDVSTGGNVYHQGGAY